MNGKVPPNGLPATRTEGEGETLDMPEGLGTFTSGQVLGERYQILEMLGRGGMGEVWKAFDLKLRVDVALKALRPEYFKSDRRLELLRQEVRAAREVVSPNVCRIFDLIEVEDRELVSMEYVDGATLLGVLQERGPLELKEAQDIASQFLAGLEAIHKVGLVHRDIKPENIMLTRAGRVVVMDFGLARQETEGGGSVSGTPAYMAPEQAAGQQLDARADVYAAGVVLAEMVSPEGVKSYESRQSVWEGVRSEPAELPDSPWAPVIKRAVARDRERRQNSAHTLIRELEDVTLRVEGAEDLHPYPGLASFTESDAEYFFGREAEVEQMWRKLEGPARMLAIMGPSGAGKTSFIRAGLASNAPSDWALLRCTPGNSAIASLRGSLSPELTQQPELLRALMTDPDNPDVIVEAIAGWRKGSTGALIVVDQFEELFTLNSRENQHGFASLLGRLPLEDDVHVLLSMRDDFAASCNDLRALQPVFHELTVLNPPTGGNLRRALVQPATKCGYRFEDDELVEEMLAEIEGERGALPTLAFAAARLWEQRDRESGLLTRQAYQDIGGVGGALARHAEATIDRIGTDRIAHVRELFRNLVTAEGTRAVREWNDLLSVFGESNRSPAEEVLRELIDARLLTSYEVREDEHEPVRRVEIIHESLLANWPRLVRWQTQDQEGAQLRDELRQAARTWGEHGRHDDRLWTGTAFLEYQLWRERYPGGLTEIEEAFAGAMVALARRRTRLRRAAVATALVVAAGVTGITTTLWRKSVLNERRAEAQKLVAMGQLRMQDHPTAALAHATASLEVRDSEEARLLALKALWNGPTSFVVNEHPSIYSEFNLTGELLVQGHDGSSSMAIISVDGSQRVINQPSKTGATRTGGSFQGQRDLFFSTGHATDAGQHALWSASKGKLLAAAKPLEEPQVWGENQTAIVVDDGRPRAVFATGKGDLISVDALYADGEHKHIGEIRLKVSIVAGSRFCMPRSSAWLAVMDGREVSVVEIGEDGLSDPRLLGSRAVGSPSHACRVDPQERFFLTALRSGRTEVWDPTGGRPPTSLDGPPGAYVWFSADGSHLLGSAPTPGEEDLTDIWIWSIDDTTFHLRRLIKGIKDSGFGTFDPVNLQYAVRGPLPDNRLWPLGAPSSAEPILLRRGPAGYVQSVNFSPDGRWLATNHATGLTMWPLVGPIPSVKRLDLRFWIGGLAFGPEGKFLATAADDTVTVIPLEGAVPAEEHTVFKGGTGLLHSLAVSRDGERFAVGDDSGGLWIGRDDGSDPILMGDRKDWGGGTTLTSFSPDGRLLAFLTGLYDLSSAVFRVWDLEAKQEIAAFSLPGEELRFGSTFSDDGRLQTATTKGVIAWDVESGEHQILVETKVANFTASSNGRRLLLTEEGESGFRQDPAGSPVFFDLDSGESTTLSSHGLKVRAMALDRAGKVAVTGDRNGIIRVGPVTGEEPHLLLGHEGQIFRLAMDPMGRWIASADDRTIRIWPMPDLSKPPLHTLPREELIAKLKTLTNLRVVRDEESATGWKLTHDPFPGWETVPTW